MSPKPRVDQSALIEEVKKRPCLYAIRNVRGVYNEKRNAAWGEIGSTLFSDKWNALSPADKDSLVKHLQMKWKSLRDNFTRHLRVQEQRKNAKTPQPMEKYVHVDQMSFLMPVFQKGSFRDKTVSSEEGKDSNDSCAIEDSSPIEQVSPAEVEFSFGNVQPNCFTSSDPIEIKSGMSFLSESDAPIKRVAKCLEELSSLQREEKLEDPMGNKNFLLSLLPFMKKLPDHLNLEVRLQLMSVLETYTLGKNLQQ
ncbi:uncharacterized protein LOC109536341 [Dendroctonus ponderosae]|uniref:uncharacterized protein LOC109536341 n=1 Tax=Dendroctonus ponderosae TaxID=77166 RepID=UPI0020356B61|nr:uncharacterized protein LOC109536341 [Dendroctonus ponderosae]KAH1014599.1 hypothetical protein HUJ05_012449 [Dendroctonus ponderosae]